MNITLDNIKLNVREPMFETRFMLAVNQFCDSPFNDEGAAIASLRGNDLNLKPGTERALSDKMAWLALLGKSERGITPQDVKALFEAAWDEYFKRELSFLRFLYR